ncbi:hypothetical protein L6164_027006 [Bauhinia variegata]|uniref:Uncharacterized protein n=1 Tax=Bauhinia variegata TaxID=167791 RepID=A0ACB9LS16_BAUVA|nr:hypothetical protein L6164_027006 [Bauhinia variegata]
MIIKLVEVHCVRGAQIFFRKFKDLEFLIQNAEWNEIRYRKKGMPPGTMSWPIFGETAAFLKQGPDFMKNKRARYGNLFKTHILGSPTVICMDPDVNRYILLNEAKGLPPGYPVSMRNILGFHSISAVHGDIHKRIRGSVLSLVGPAATKDHLFPKTDKFTRLFLDNWAGKTIDIQERTKQLAFFVVMNHIVEDEPFSFLETFKATFDIMYLGTISLPIKIPGTNYSRGIKAREKVIAILKELIAKRRASSETFDDILDHLLRDEAYKLSDEEMLDQIITLLYSGYETTSVTTMMVVKYLHHHPKALQAIRDEHFAIKQRKELEEPLNWDDYKNMTFTRAVIFETLRLASVINGPMRKTTRDVELNGLTIPKGWRVYVYIGERNYDPFIYEEPFTFNPWRWLVEKDLESYNHMIFGGGGRLCPGKELGLAKISLFLHYFVTKYRWEEVEGNKLRYFPRVEAPNGLYIRVAEY